MSMRVSRRDVVAGVVLGWALGGMCAGAAAASLEEIQQKKVIHIGIQTDFPPYGYIDARMQPQGSDVATAELIAQKLGVALKIVTLTAPARIPSLQTGKVDLVVSSLGKNAEREKVIDFSISYAPFFSGLYAAKGLQLQSFADLKGQRISVTRGSLQDDAITQRAPAGADIKRFEDDTATIASFLTGQSQVLAASAGVAAVTLQRNPQLDAQYKLLLTDVTCYVGVAKGNTALRDQVNTILRAAKADGTLNAIAEKYLGRPLGELGS